MSQQCVLVAKKSKSILGCIRKIVAVGQSRWSPLLTGGTHLECYVQFWPSQFKKDMDILKWVQSSSTKIKWLEHLMRITAALQSGEDNAQLMNLMDLMNVYQCLMGGMEEDWVRLFSVVPNDRKRGNGQKFKNRKFTTQENTWATWPAEGPSN